MSAVAFDTDDEFLVLTHRAVDDMSRLLGRSFRRDEALAYLVSLLSLGSTHKLEPDWPTGPARLVLVCDWEAQREFLVRLVSPTNPDGTRKVAPDREKVVAIVTDFWEK